MSVPPPPDHRPPRRRPQTDVPEESLTTQLFVGQPRSADPQEDTVHGVPPVAGPQQVSGRPDQHPSSPSDGDEPEATQVLSIEELAQLAAETHDDRLDGPRPDAASSGMDAGSPGVRATRADEEWAKRQVAPSQWPGQMAGSAPTQNAPAQAQHPQNAHTQNAHPQAPQSVPGAPPPPQSAPSVGAEYRESPQGQPGGAAGSGPTYQAGAAPGYSAGYPAGTDGGYGTAAQSRQPVPSGAPLPPPGPPRASGTEKKSGLPGIAIAVIVIVGIIVAAIIGYILYDVFAGSPSGENQAVPVPPPASEASQDPGESAGEGTGGSEAPADDVTAFALPSGNIVCSIDAERARCTIEAHEFEAPEKPADCQMESWGSVVVANDDGAGFSCQEAEAPADPQVLEYGESVQAHGMTCSSSESGVTCVSDATQRGFSLSRAAADFTN